MSAPVSLRPMRWWDLEEVVRLEPVLFPDDAWSPEQLWSELAGVPSSRTYVVAESDGQIVGYAGLWAHGEAADVQTVAVAPGGQRRGTGTLLVEALLDDADRRGVGEVVLEVRADNIPALELYRAVGFERVGVRRGYYAAGRVDALVLRLRRGSGAIIGR
ncbi:MAG TPA: ribosomal protein S18-alanine N-acetyltransferase [Jiangellales bacterium]|nr:ribosomal protein S18-alanine N-acetyltransferase [Jiangellales bacterium]